MSTKPVTLYDTTLRDGTQGTGISFSVLDKIRVAEKLDAFGIDYIEGGWPGSNPKDAAFFEQAAERDWKHAKIAAFGMTRRGRMKVEEDSQVGMLLAARTPVVTIVGKTWPLHVAEVFGVSLEENLAMIADTVRFLKEHGREVFYDAEHFFDSFRENPEYSLATIKAAHEAGADLIVLCDTNGGSLPDFVGRSDGESSIALELTSRHPHPQRWGTRCGQCPRGDQSRRGPGSRHYEWIWGAGRQLQSDNFDSHSAAEARNERDPRYEHAARGRRVC